MDKYQSIKQFVADAKNIVFFGGAGVSTASGIPDFRSASGLYTTKASLAPETILSATYFWYHTKEFFDFYRRFMLYPDARPNEVHKTLAKLEASGKLSAVITQNIDGLHQMAGSKKVIELHGSVLRNHCTHCDKAYGLDYILSQDGVPKCKVCGGVVKPDVVLYEEALDMQAITDAEQALARADALIVAGTSLTVYPASSFAAGFGGKLAIINRTPTFLDAKAQIVIREDMNEVFASLGND